jgi:hypothetical protein
MIASIRNFLKQYITSKALRNLILVYLLFTVLVNVLRDSIQGVENSLLMLIIGIGLIFGWLLAISKISDWMMWLIAVLSGGTVLTIRVGRLGPLLSSMFLQYIDLVRQNIQWLFNQVPPSRSSTIYLDIAELGSRLATLGSRLGFWIQSLFRGRPIFDPVATAFIWGILIWLIAIWMIWMTVRIQRPLVGIIPIMTLTGLSLVYTEKSVYNLIPMLGFMVGLVVMVRYDVHEDQWKLENIKYAGIIRERMMVFSITLAIGLMVFASFSPSISIESIVDFINRITSDTKDDDLARSLGLEPPKRPGNVNVLDSKRVGGLPNQHLVNSGEELSDQIVMIIQVEGFSDSNADSLGISIEC